MKGYMVMELQYVSEMVVIKVKVDDIFNTFWRLYSTTQINQHYYLFFIDMSFYLDSLRSANSGQFITIYGRIHLFDIFSCVRG